MVEIPDSAYDDKLLAAAWQRQQTYSKNASRHQQRFIFLRTLLAILSILVVALAIIEDSQTLEKWHGFVDHALLVLPILITGLVGFSVRFDRGQNWILLRGSAESLKREIYFYRTRIKPYHTDCRGVILSERMQHISDGLKGSPVHHGAMAPYEREISPYTGRANIQQRGILLRLVQGMKDAFASLSKAIWKILFSAADASSIPDNKYATLTEPDDYIKYRLDIQFEWYRKQSKDLAQQLQVFQSGIYLFGGIGTLLAAFEGTRSWVAVTTALVGGFTNYLEVKRIESSLVGYNQAADALYDIRTWWYALSPKESKNPAKFKRLVDSCEGTIRSETTSWLQDMQDRLADLYGLGDDDTDVNGESDNNPDATPNKADSKQGDVKDAPDKTDDNNNEPK